MSLDDIAIAQPGALATSDHIRKLRGLSPINPNRIEGFDNPNEPIPSFDNPYPPVQQPDPMEADFHAPVSPLIPQATASGFAQGATTTAATTTSYTISIPQHDYLEIWYQGNKVQVSGQLQLDVERLILLGVQKEIAEKLNSLKPRRVPTRVSEVRGTQREQGGPSPVAAIPVKRRGRPKGSLNKKTLAKAVKNAPLVVEPEAQG